MEKEDAKNDSTISLSKVKTLKDYKLDSLDGEIGNVKDFYFDDQYWTIRYLVADQGYWLTDRQLLISPYAFGAVNKDEKGIAINLTKKQIEDSPPLDPDKPVSRQFEDDYYGYYGWPAYYTGEYQWGLSPFLVRDRDKWSEFPKGENRWDPYLRSTNVVSGYQIQASDGEIGNVEDFVVDEDTWTIRYLVINTSIWWGKDVLISPKWIERISWDESKVFVNLTREAIKKSPEFTEESLLTRDYEVRLHQHYDRQGYWAS